MPNLDGTGPLGKGPMTGRGEGYCILKKSAADNTVTFKGYAGVTGQLVKYKNQINGQNRKEVMTMPGGNRTGPMGMGPMTGRAAGYCAGYPVPGYMNPIPGGGPYSFGAGGTYGVPNAYPPAYGYGPYPMGRPLGYGFRGRGGRRGGGRGRLMGW